ncbi:Acg family FMN-binding oxidoreductase [Aquipuribacter sp. MA13-6]|uniref:Acg family FMN-binding oxidoreductase n=1 Tax=unclassified Aquipuribacter TaxID=2635084 RepID=UPI003EEA0ADD
MTGEPRGTFSVRDSPATVGLAGLNVLAFALLTTAPGLREVLGLSDGWAGLSERPWAPVTVMFTSENLLHMVLVVGMLLLFGREVERALTPGSLVAIYVVSGLAGSLVMVAATGPSGFDGTALGASAAAMGVVGALAVLPAQARRFRVGPLIGVVLLVNIVGPLLDDTLHWISTFGHLAGLAAGAACAYPNRRRADRRSHAEERDVLRAALESAVRAPSGHNTQPWSFRLGVDQVELYADRTRALPVVDPDDRALIISCGAALAFLLVGLRATGFAGDLVRSPDPDQPDLLAQVGRGHPRTPTERDLQMFAAIDRRHTDRAPFQGRAVPEDVLAAMTADADRFGITLHVALDDAAKQRVGALVADGDRAQMADPRFRDELAAWVRSNYTRRGDGMPGYAFGVPGLPSLVGPLIMRGVDMGDRQARKDSQLAATAPALLLLTSTGDTPSDWLAAGQAVASLLLTATSAGLAASFLNQPIETTALRGPLAELFDAAGARPQLLLRLGYPDTAARPTPRRPVDSVLTHSDALPDGAAGDSNGDAGG